MIYKTSSLAITQKIVTSAKKLGMRKLIQKVAGGNLPIKNSELEIKPALDIFWLKDNSLTDTDNLPEPDILATEIIENLESGLNSFREVLGILENVS